MSRPSRSQTRSTASRPSAAHWEELASLMIVIAREIRFRGYPRSGAYPHSGTLPLTQTEASVMHYLFANPGASPSQVAFGTGLQRSNVSTLLRALTQKGLVERVADPDDARSVHLRATPLAIRNYKLVRREWGTTVKAAADGEGEVETALALLRKIADGMIRDRQLRSTH